MSVLLDVYPLLAAGLNFSEIFIKFFSFEFQPRFLHLFTELILLFSQHMRSKFQTIKQIGTVQCLYPKCGIFLWKQIGTKGRPTQCRQFLWGPLNSGRFGQAVTLGICFQCYAIRLSETTSTVKLLDFFVLVIAKIIIESIILHVDAKYVSPHLGVIITADD
jgi:hypothetical protein